MAKQESRTNRKSYAELTGIDFSTTGVKIVRLRRSKDAVVLVGADLLPPHPFDHTAHAAPEFPKPLMANYAAIAYTGENGVIRIVQMNMESGGKADDTDQALRQQLNLDDSYRAGSYLVHQSKGKQEALLLAAAIPRRDLGTIMTLFPSGAPAPCSLEISGLAAFSGFMNMQGERHKDDSLCLVESGARVSIVAFLVRGQPALVAKFPVGSATLSKRVEADLGVDADMVRTILAGGSVDISSSVGAVMSPLLRQLSVSRDFVERQHKTRISHVYISGGLARSPYWVDPIQECMNVNCVAWDPLEGLKIPPGAWPDKLLDQQHRYGAAIGAALGGLVED